MSAVIIRRFVDRVHDVDVPADFCNSDSPHEVPILPCDGFGRFRRVMYRLNLRKRVQSLRSASHLLVMPVAGKPRAERPKMRLNGRAETLHFPTVDGGKEVGADALYRFVVREAVVVHHEKPEKPIPFQVRVSYNFDVRFEHIDDFRLYLIGLKPFALGFCHGQNGLSSKVSRYGVADLACPLVRVSLSR